MPSPSTPKIIQFQVTAGKTSNNQVEDLTIIFRNETTNETLSATTNFEGKALVDGQNFTSGASTGDVITAWIDNYAQYDDVISIENNDIRIGE